MKTIRPLATVLCAVFLLRLAAGQAPATNMNPNATPGVATENVPMSMADIATVPPAALVAGNLSLVPAQLQTLVDDSCDPSTAGSLDPDPVKAAAAWKALLKKKTTARLFNVIFLAPLAAGVQGIQSDNWYVYEPNLGAIQGFHGWQQADFDGSSRLYGAKNVILVTLVLNSEEATTPQVSYTMKVTKQTSVNVSDAYGLLSLFAPAAGLAVKPSAKLAVSLVAPAPPYAFAGCAIVPIPYKISSIVVATSYEAGTATTGMAQAAADIGKAASDLAVAAPGSGTSAPAAIQAAAQALQVAATTVAGAAAANAPANVTYTNAAKSWWDVSFALPVTKASALQFTPASSTAGATVTPSTVSKQSLFAVMDIYVPFVDLSKTTHLIPHPFAGVGMVSKPLQNQLYGLAIGFNLAEFYAGVLRVKSAVVGTTNTYAYENKFSVGIKISTSGAATAIAKAK